MPMMGGMYQGPQNWSDRLAIIGAALKDASPSSQGGNLSAAQQMLMQRQMAQYQMGMMGKLSGLFGSQPQYQDGPAPTVSAPAMPGTSAMGPPSAPGAPTGGLDDPSGALAAATASVAPGPSPAPAQPYTYQPPTKIAGTGPASLSDPETQRTLVQAAMFGVPGSKEALDILDKSRPTVKIGPDGTPYDERDVGALMRHFANRTAVNNQVIDLNDPSNNNRYIPTAPVPGAIPVQDAGGHITDFGLPRGSAQAIGAAEAAKVGATEAAKLPYVGPAAYAAASGTKAGELPYAGPIAQASSAGTAAGSGPYDMITVDVNGVPTTMSKAQFAALQGVGGAPPTARPTFGSAQAAGILSRLLPGAVPTSGARSAAHNAAVGGVPDSLHLEDGAIDFVPPKGADFNAFKAKLVANGLPASELINEGNHWHWGFAPKSSAPSPAPVAAPATGGIRGVNPADAKSVQAALDAAKAAEDTAGLGDQFIKLNKGTATGPIYDDHRVHLPVLGEVPLNPLAGVMRSTHNDVRAMDALSTQMALTMRAPGQRMTQVEFLKNLAASPSRNNPRGQNESSVQSQHDIAATKRAYATFVSDWVAQHGSLQGADATWASMHQPGAAGAKTRLKWNPQTGAIQ